MCVDVLVRVCGCVLVRGDGCVGRFVRGRGSGFVVVWAGAWGSPRDGSGRFGACLFAKLYELWLQEWRQRFFDQEIHQEVELFEVSKGFLFLFVVFDVKEVCAVGFEGDFGEAQEQEAEEILRLFFFAGVELIEGGAQPADALFLRALGGFEFMEGMTWATGEQRATEEQSAKGETERSTRMLLCQRAMIPFWRSW